MKLLHLCIIKALQDANKGLKMKKFVLILWVLFSVQCVFAQGWLQRYGNRSDNTSFQAIAPTQDGGYFQVGYTNGSTQLYLVKTDAEGNVITSKKYPTDKPILNEVHLTDAGDGNFVIAYATDTALGKNNLFIEKINQNCKKIWTQSFGNSFPVYVGDIKRLSDNSIATLVTQTSRIGDSAAILKTTQQGVTFLQKNVMPLNGIRASSLTESSDKALFFTTRSNGARDSARLIKTNPNAVLQWNKTIGTLDGTLTFTNINTIEALPDGGFAVLGNYFGKIDTNGVTQWFVNQKLITFPSNFIINPDASFSVLTGFDTLVVRKLSLYKISSAGKIISNKAIGTFDVLSSNFANNFGLANTSDGGIVITGEENRSDGGVSARTMKIGVDGILFVNEINGRVFIDKNNNCKLDVFETGFSNAMVELTSRTNPNKIRRARPDSTGAYTISIDTGNYVINLRDYGSYFTACTDAVTFTDDIKYPLAVETHYLGLKPINACAQMEVTVSTPALQRCQLNNYKLHYCNISGNPAQNVYATVKLDSLLAFQKADRGFSLVGTRTYRFEIGFVDAGQCGDISFTVLPACKDSTIVGQALSIEAHIYPDSFCVVPNNWSGATLSVEGQCATDSVRLLVRNVGKSPSTTQTSTTNIVIIDEVVFLKAAPSLQPQGTSKYSFPTNGKTYRLEVPQEANSPGFSKAPTVAVEGCGRKADGSFSIGYVKQFSEDDGDYFVDKDVRILRNDLFSNELDASPTGYAVQHFINNNDDIEYLVRFRNTSNDTLYNVEVRDTLSDFIDPTTIELGASSHPFQMQMFEKKILKFLFNNVAIVPDSVNKDKSWGFLKFRVKLKSNIPNGTLINNRADILFNNGSVISTNKIFHTVGQNFVVTATVDEPTIDNNLVKINIAPNPFSEQAQFTIDTKETILGTHTFEVYDVTGRLVRREFFEGNQFIFERQNLSDQMYVYRIIIHDSKYSASGKLMVRK